MKTFSVGFGEGAYSELSYAAEVARHLGTDHCELTVSERDMIEHLHSTVLPRINDCRDLSRPVRRRSHYPTMVAVANSINKAQKMGEETQALAEYLHECLQDIRERARKEKVNRL